ncbi:MAG: FprA family A-type flavoprotein [Spirochaetia bacterium]|jgi:flavorubredoxin|nr:FprA family A-type flavoprotein [Spirochaetia bacterium]
MKAAKISDHVWALHADIDTEDRFEGIWPIPNGVSLNSYLIKGEKTALIDLVRDWCGAASNLTSQLAESGVELAKIDYLILNHLEPDHTGWLAEFKAQNPGVQIIATAKGIELVKSFYKIQDGLKAVKSGDILDLGGVQLRFEETPNVHWPETMMTFEPESGTLFSCDAFGGFGKLGKRVFDDEYYAEEHAFFLSESLRYYANIVGSFSLFVKRAVEKLAHLEIKIVAPSHGIIWREKPQVIIDRYLKYAGYMEGPQEKEICVVWGSMYGNTKKGLDMLLKGIEDERVPFTVHRVPEEDVSFVLADAFKSSGIVLAMPTYEYKMFPPMAYVMDIFERKHVWNRKALRIGSFGWVGGAKKEYEQLVAPLKWAQTEPVEWAGAPDEATLTLLRERGREFARIVKGE